jgi:NADPH:quinone reductase
MRAVRLHQFNGPLTVEEVPDPVTGDGELLVELTHAAVNPLDVWCCQGNFAALTKLPHTPGAEGVGRLADGTMGLVNGAGVGLARAGTYAQKIAAPAASWTAIPGSKDPIVAVSLAVAGITAWRTVHACAQLQAGETVLVLGATGGVGSLAAQIARNLGATVIGQTSSAKKVDTVHAAGVSEVIVAGDGDALVSALGDRKVNVVIDGLGGTFTPGSVACMAPFGRLVNYGTSAGVDVTLQMRNLYRNGISLIGYTGLLLTTQQRSETIAALFAELDAGRLQVPIDSVLPLSEAGAAHQRILDRQVEGKLILDVNAR